MAELVTVVQSMRPAVRASRTSGFGVVDVAAFVDDGLRDDAAGGGEHFGEHFAAAAGAGEEESFAVGVRREALRRGLRRGTRRAKRRP